MKRVRIFINNCLIGGIVVILPLIISLYFLKWFMGVILGVIQPMTGLLIEQTHIQKPLAQGLIILTIIMIFFFIGLAVKTRIGRFFLNLTERVFLKSIPGYKLFSETIKQLFDKDKKPFSSVALVKPFGNETMQTGFITDTHADGTCTVFVPCGLNPTSGAIYHLGSEDVKPLDVPVESAMRTIIGCGTGSRSLIKNIKI